MNQWIIGLVLAVIDGWKNFPRQAEGGKISPTWLCLGMISVVFWPGTGRGGEEKPGPTLELEWSCYFGSTNDENGESVESITADEEGNVYLAGNTSGTDLAGATNRHLLKPDDFSWRGYVAKLDNSGSVKWSTYLCTGYSGAAEVALDRQGHVYAVGFTFSGQDVPGGNFDQPGCFVAQLDAVTGDVRWARALGTGVWPVGVDPGLAVDGDGFVVVGHTADRDQVPQATNKKQPGADALVTKLTPEGAVAWSTFIGGRADDSGHDLALDRDGNIYLSGRSSFFTGPPAPDEPYDLPQVRNRWRGRDTDGFVACLNPSGEVQWSVLVGGREGDTCDRIVVSPNDYIIVGGTTGSGDLNPPLVGPSAPGGPFLTALDRQGTVLWSAHSPVWDRAALADLTLSGDGTRLLGPEWLVHGLGFWQADAETGEALRFIPYADVFEAAHRGAYRITPSGSNGIYYTAGNTDEKQWPKVRNGYYGGRTDVYVSRVQEKEVVPFSGAIGLATWATQAEFKDLQVTQGDQVLFLADFATGAPGWRVVRGDWQVQDGAYRQVGEGTDLRAVAGDPDWSDYTYRLKARKLGGAEGFLIMFRVRNDNNWLWWNLGGWGNRTHAIEKCVNGGKSILGNTVPGRMETDRWYDLRIELQGPRIRCYLDGHLIHDVEDQAP